MSESSGGAPSSESSKQNSESRMRDPSPLLIRREIDRARRAAAAEPGAKNQNVNCRRVVPLLWSRGTQRWNDIYAHPAAVPAQTSIPPPFVQSPTPLRTPTRTTVHRRRRAKKSRCRCETHAQLRRVLPMHVHVCAPLPHSLNRYQNMNTYPCGGCPPLTWPGCTRTRTHTRTRTRAQT